MKQASLINCCKANILVIASPRTGETPSAAMQRLPCAAPRPASQPPQTCTLTSQAAFTTSLRVLPHQPLCVSEHYCILRLF